MKPFRVKSDEHRRIKLNWDMINTYTSRYIAGTFFEIEIVRRQKKKSDPMRKYFWSVVMPGFLEAYYYEPDEAEKVHELCKCTFFGIQPDKRGIYRNADIPRVFSNESDIPIERKQAYVEWMKRKAAMSDNPVYIPDPGE